MASVVEDAVSHYHLAVIIPLDGDVRESINDALAPFEATNGYPPGENWYGLLHWDWWRIGGRYDGRVKAAAPRCLICEGDGVDAIHHHYTDAHEQVENNCVNVRDLREDFHCWGILEPNGTYTERYRPGSYDTQTDEEWLPTQDSIINRYLDYRIVSVDFHN